MKIGENHVVMTAYRLLLLAVLINPASQAVAQTLPWPTDPPQPAVPSPSPCTAEFAKLRQDVQQLGLAAKAAGQRKVSRQEMCGHITAYSAAELKWVNYAQAEVTTCGIPAQVVSQLKQVHGNTEQIKEKICAVVGPGLDVPGPERRPAGYMFA